MPGAATAIAFLDCYNSRTQDHHVPSRASTMSSSPQSDVTRLLVDWQHGDKMALDQLMPIVYRELRKVAASYLKSERPDHTLNQQR